MLNGANELGMEGIQITDSFDEYLTRKFAGEEVFSLVEWLDDLDVGDWSLVSFKLSDDSEQAFVFLYNSQQESCVLAECFVNEVPEVYGGMAFSDENEIHFVHSISLENDSDLKQLILDALCEIHAREIETDG